MPPPRSPRTWGWTVASGGDDLAGVAFPTHVGMDRQSHRRLHRARRVPHARGDGPFTKLHHFLLSRRSPRTWGWTAGITQVREAAFAFPTHVGMDRRVGEGPEALESVPHARGDGPSPSLAGSSDGERSPRTWGWTASPSRAPTRPSAFPTHVGMDRQGRHRPGDESRVPHARGDGPLNCCASWL